MNIQIDNGSGWLAAVAALVLCVLTWLYLRATERIAAATLQSVREAQRQREDMLRPVVDLVVPDTGLGRITTVDVRNVSPGPALNLVVHLALKTVIARSDQTVKQPHEENFALYGPTSLGTGSQLAQASVPIDGEARTWLSVAADKEESDVHLWATYSDVYGGKWRTEVSLLFHEPPRKGSGYAEAFWYVRSGVAVTSSQDGSGGTDGL